MEHEYTVFWNGERVGEFTAENAESAIQAAAEYMTDDHIANTGEQQDRRAELLTEFAAEMTAE